MFQQISSVVSTAEVAPEAPAVMITSATVSVVAAEMKRCISRTAGGSKIAADVTVTSGRVVVAPVPLVVSCLSAALAVCVVSVAARSAGGVPHVIGVHVAVPAITAVACGRFLSPIVLALSVVGIVPSVLI